MTTRRIFVYGTLMRGFGNHRMIAGRGGVFVGTGAIGGDGKGYGMGTWSGHVPVVFPVKWGGIVRGEVYDVPEAVVFNAIDKLEGHPYGYQRTPVTVTSDRGERWECEAYLMTLERVEETIAVPSGDFRRVKPKRDWTYEQADARIPV